MTVRAAGGNEGSCENGFVTNIIIQAYGDDYVLFDGFQEGQTYYQLELPSYFMGASPKVLVEMTSSSLRHSTSLEGGDISRQTTSCSCYGETTVDVVHTTISGGIAKSPYGLTSQYYILDHLRTGETYTLRINIHETDREDTGDVYVFDITYVPTLNSLSASANGRSVEVSPYSATTSSASAYNREYYMATAANQIVLTGTIWVESVPFQTYTYKFNGVDETSLVLRTPVSGRLIMNGEDVTEQFTTAGVTLDLDDYTPNNDGVYEILFSIIHAGEISTETQYILYIQHVDGADWNITRQPQGGTYDKGDTVELSVDTNMEEAAAYQWQWSSSTESFTFDDLEGETSATYQASAAVAGVRYYRCLVTNELTGEYMYSDTAAVTVNLGQVNEPTIIYQPGVYNFTSGTITSSYRTTYLQGEPLDPIQLAVGSAEGSAANDSSGLVRVTLQWYYNTECSTTGATPLDGSNCSKVITCYGSTGDPVFSVQGSFYSYSHPETLPIGDHYFYFVATATSNTDPNNAASITSDFVKITVVERGELEGFEGRGTEDDPYLISSVEQLERIDKYVLSGNFLAGAVFQFTNDITLPKDWEPIGQDNGGKGVNLLPFSGIIDGAGYTLTVEAGGRPLLEYARNAVVRNLNIYGEEINGAGLLDKASVDYGTDGVYQQQTDPDIITIENVTVLSGTKTSGSGLANGGYSSGINDIIVRNCTIESGVIVGYNKDQSNIGSFVGTLNGRIENSVSHATVYGTNTVGGLAGKKGQSMGDCSIINSAFIGTIEATGGRVGGIIGAGYISVSAPNTPPVTVKNCYVVADITGNSETYVVSGEEQGSGIGGIFGTEFGLVAPWNNASISDNHFYGTITDTNPDESTRYARVGGILGELGKYDSLKLFYENNYYLANDNYDGLGYLVRTNADWAPERQSFISKSVESFSDGTVTALMNEGSDYKNWVQGELYPVFSGVAIVSSLELSGTYQTEYTLGDSLDLTGMEITAVYSDGHKETVSVDDVTIEGFDGSARGVQTVTIKYQGAEATITVTVLKPDGKIMVSFSLLGDYLHTEGETEIHTLTGQNLTEWITVQDYLVDTNATVKDVIEQALTANGMTWSNPTGYYIESVTQNGVTLAQKDNGPNSGWMYTINGIHPSVGVAEQFLEDEDEIIFHYTDDYTLEKDDEGDKPDPGPGSDASAEELKNAYEKTGANLASQMPNSGSVGGEWLVLGLARANYDFSEAFKQTYLEAARGYIEDVYADGKLSATSSTENSRLILALTALGEDPAAFVPGKNLLTGLADFDWVQAQGINGPIWALIALDSLQYEIPGSSYANKTTRDLLINCILDAQLSNGGWATSGTTADADMTAMAVQALAPYYKTNSSVKDAVNKAVSRLSKMQNAATGAYVNSDGDLNAESTAQVIVALTSLGIDPDTDYDFITDSNLSVMDGLMLFYNGDGMFMHTNKDKGNRMATEQSYYALVSYYRLLNHESSLYDMTDVASAGDRYTITVYTANGTVSAPAYAVAGTLVEVTVKANLGYTLEMLDMNGTELDVDRRGRASFIMPEEKVRLLAYFVPSETLITDVEKAMNDLTVTDADEETYLLIQQILAAYDALSEEEQENLAHAYENFLLEVRCFEELLEKCIEEALEDLEYYYGRMDRDDYSSENWKKIREIYTTAKSNLRKAVYAEQVEEILDKALDDIDDIKKGGEIEVTFRLIGDLPHEDSVNDHEEYVTWIETTEYELEAGSTVYDLFVMAIDDFDLNERGSGKNYVSTIQAPNVLGGYWLGEFDNGPNSGWMYTVNGDHPAYGLQDWELEDGDEVIWHYVDDYIQEERRSSSKYYYRWLEADDISPEEYVKDKMDEILTVGKNGEVDPDELSYRDLGRNVTFKFKPDKGYVVEEVIVDGKSLGSVETYTYKDLQIYSRIEVTFKSDVQARIDELPDASEITHDNYKLYVTLVEELREDYDALSAQEKRNIDAAKLIAAEERIKYFSTMDNIRLPFVDVTEGSWYYDAVVYAYANNLFNGTTATTFEPNMPMSRAMLVTVLWRIEGEPTAIVPTYFADVPAGTWYSDAVAWAGSTGIVNGVSATQFDPNADVTREQIATILYRYAKTKGWDIYAAAPLTGFVDGAETSSWATRAMEWACAEQFIVGANGRLNPCGQATRAEVATILMRLLESQEN